MPATHGGLVSQYRSNRALNALIEGALTTWAGNAFQVPTIRLGKNYCATVVRLAKPSSLRPLWRTRGWRSTGKSTEESTRLTPSKYLYVSINWPLRRRCSRGMRLSRRSRSSYGVLRNSGISFVTRRWIRSACFLKVVPQNWTPYSRWGLIRVL